MWQFAKGDRKLIILFLLTFTISQLILLSNPLIFREFLNEIQHNGLGDHNIAYLITILFVLLAVDLVFWVLHGPSRILENIVAFRTELKYKKYLLGGVLGLGLSWHTERDSGNTIDKINKASEAMFQFSRNTFIIIEVFVQVIGTTIILLFFNIYIGLVALALLIVALLIIFQFDLRLVPQYKKLNLFDNKILARIFDVLSNITTIKVLNIEKPIVSSTLKIFWKPFQLYKKNKILIELKWFTGSVLFTFIVVLPLTVYVLFSLKHNIEIEVGTLSALYLYLSGLIGVYYVFTSTYEGMIIRRTKILNAVEIEEAFLAKQKIKKKKIPHWDMIHLQNVLFSYGSVRDNVYDIQNISFDIFRGERIALIGESGSGKTTFLKVIHGMYPNSKAEISFDGRVSQETNFADINLKTTLVPQEPEIFSSSIRENITLGIGHTEKEILDATNLSEFTSVISRLPKGLSSVVNEKGVNLSGGQKQRLALARALLFSGDKEVILLDESTSSVDSETEVKIYKSIFKHFKSKTVVASIHKMNLLKYFDRIVMFTEGKIVDQGTFDELMSRNKKFQKDWNEYVSEHKDVT